MGADTHSEVDRSPTQTTRLAVTLAVATFSVALLFSYGPQAPKMMLPAALGVSLMAAAAALLSGYRPVIAVAVVTVLTGLVPIVDANLQVLDLVIVLVIFRASLLTDVKPWILAVVAFSDLTVNDAWQRVTFHQGWMEPSVLYPGLLTALSVGLGLQSRRVRVQNHELSTLREADRQLAASEERRRIARDLHDIAAHHLTALIVRNRLAVRVNTTEAFEAAARFTADTTADALDAVRQVVRVLNTDHTSPLKPIPGLGDFDDVIERMRVAGLTVVTAGSFRPAADRAVDLAAIRIVAEALVNVLRHRGPGNCWVTVEDDGSTVSVTVEDDGPGTWSPHAEAAAWATPGSYGLIGMRERAEACAGRLVIGPSSRGGWKVAATLPLGTR